MKFLFDFFPIALFFGMFKWGESRPDAAQGLLNQYLGGFINGGVIAVDQAPIMLATAVAILATFLQIGWLLLRRKKVDTMLWVSLAIITIFGGATIYFHNETFIKWKPTVLYWCMGGALLFAQLLFKKNLIRSMLEAQISLPDPIWTKLNLAWGLFFVVMGVINLYVAFNFTLSTWVSFKLFGFTGLIFAFAIGQSLFLSKYVKDPQ